jgi:hypothetical protein
MTWPVLADLCHLGLSVWSTEDSYPLSSLLRGDERQKISSIPGSGITQAQSRLSG